MISELPEHEPKKREQLTKTEISRMIYIPILFLWSYALLIFYFLDALFK